MLHYRKPLVALGAAGVLDLVELEESDCAEIGMKLLEVRRLKREVSTWVSRQPQLQPQTEPEPEPVLELYPDPAQLAWQSSLQAPEKRELEPEPEPELELEPELEPEPEPEPEPELEQLARQVSGLISERDQ